MTERSSNSDEMTPSAALEQLRELDEALARRGVPREASERVRRELQQRAHAQPFHARLRWWPALAFAAGAVVMLALLIELPGRRESAPEPSRIAPEDTPVAERGGAEAGHDHPRAVEPREPCTEIDDGERELEIGTCVSFDGVRVSALMRTRLRRDRDLVELHEGEALFEVQPRPEHPLHVRAGEVDVEVVGTRFVVHQLGEVGWVSMLDGRVRVTRGADETRELARGERLEWPEPVETEATVAIGAAPGSAASRDRGTPAASDRSDEAGDEGLDTLLDEVAALRRRGEFGAAVERLRNADTRGWSRRARQLLSYELGSLLERQLGDVDAACAHWTSHRERFEGGRYDEIVARSMVRMGCG